MAKSSSKNKATASATEEEKREKSVTSIDDIFAKPANKSAPLANPSSSSTSKTKAKSTAAPSAPVASGSGSGEKKKKKKNKVAASFDPSTEPAGSPTTTSAVAAVAVQPKSRVVEVVDPSIPQPAKTEANAVSAKKGKKRDRGDVEADEAFKDSRGDGPRRKTEEGFLIYKEAELDIDPEAGGTPLCPFDCDCCF